MTNGQIAQLQELSKCWNLLPGYRNWVSTELQYVKWDKETGTNTHLKPFAKALLRRLAHQYRHQIKVMKKNRISAEPDDS